MPCLLSGILLSNDLTACWQDYITSPRPAPVQSLSTSPESHANALGDTTFEDNSPEPNGPEARSPEASSPEARSPELSSPEAKSPEAKSPETISPEANSPTGEVEEDGGEALEQHAALAVSNVAEDEQHAGAHDQHIVASANYGQHEQEISSCSTLEKAMHDNADRQEQTTDGNSSHGGEEEWVQAHDSQEASDTPVVYSQAESCSDGGSIAAVDSIAAEGTNTAHDQARDPQGDALAAAGAQHSLDDTDAGADAQHSVSGVNSEARAQLSADDGIAEAEAEAHAGPDEEESQLLDPFSDEAFWNDPRGTYLGLRDQFYLAHDEMIDAAQEVAR